MAKPPDRPSGQYHQAHVDVGERLPRAPQRTQPGSPAPPPAGAPRPPLPELPELEPPTPRSGVPPVSNPPPVSVPTSSAEREAASLRARLEDERQARLAAQQALAHAAAVLASSKQVEADTVDRRRTVGEAAKDAAKTYAAPGGIVAALVTAIASLLKPAPAPESVDAHGARIAVVEREQAQKRSRELDQLEYLRKQNAALACLLTEAGSALLRLGYKTSLPTDAEAFVSERLERAAVTPGGPAWKAKEPCPPMPREPAAN